jgi:YfiH family protein
MPNTSSSENITLHAVFPVALTPNLVHGYSQRAGGVSLAPYASLNLGSHVGDDLDNVRANRRLFSEVLGIPAERWVTAEQVHGGDVAQVTEVAAGWKIPGVDALVTDVPDLPLALFYADCASLFFYDPAQRAIGLAHAGWRGTVAEIAIRTARGMAEAFGSRPKELLVGLGPHIGPCCYEVGEEVVTALERWEGAIQHREERAFADLGAANRAQLLSAGISKENIYQADPCTSCDVDAFFSYRREGPTGRMAAVLMLRSE